MYEFIFYTVIIRRYFLPVLLDITRTLSRVGMDHATGIDRVELAYIDAFQVKFTSLKLIARMGKFFFILSVDDLNIILAQAAENKLSYPRGIDRFRLKLSIEQRSIRTAIRLRAITQCRLGGVKNMLKAHFLSEFDYYNVGQSNLSDAFLSKLHKGGCRNIHIFIHDMIPLDHPEYSRLGEPLKFKNKMQAVAKWADRIICNSVYTSNRVESYFKDWGKKVNICVAYLGVDHFSNERIPVYKLHNKPYFLCVGTIEPRKNHKVLFEIWKILVKELSIDKVPDLLIVGRRGWNNKDVFDFLDRSVLMGKHIFEENNLSDQQLAGVYEGAIGLLFPSHIEGYGLPVIEAQKYNLPVFCSDLEVFHELFKMTVTYINCTDAEQWSKIIKKCLNSFSKESNIFRSTGKKKLPTWAEHFEIVLTANSLGYI